MAGACKTNRTQTKQVIQIIFFIFFVFSQNIYSQVQTNWWYFGTGAGVEFFSTGSPIPAPGGSTAASEGVSSASDEVTGNLLFYSDGLTVWDATHAIMPNGLGLMGRGSSTQACLIVPDPGSSTKFYVFTTDDVPHNGVNGLRYSIVDMSLHGGLGDVVVASKNTLLFAPCSEQLSAVRHDNCVDWWVMAKGFNDNVYHAFQVSASGVGSSVTTTVGAVTSTSSWGQSKFSPDGTKYAISTNGISQLFNFNNATGVISSPLSLVVAAGDTYGLSFSCDSKKLYVFQGSSAARLYQYDLTSGVPATILASATFIATCSVYNSLQLGRDYKLYVANSGGGALSVVNNPTIAGVGCGYSGGAVPIAGTASFGLPNFPDSYFNCVSPCVLPMQLFMSQSNLSCSGNNTGIASVNAAYGLSPYTYSWSPGGSTNDSIFNLSPGTYVVTVTDMLGETISDSVTITSPPLLTINASVTSDSVCAGIAVTYSSITAGGTGTLVYQWSTGAGDVSATNVQTPASSGYTSVTVTDANGCTAVDSVYVTVLPMPSISSSPDTCICSGASATITASGTPTYTWNTGQTTANITVSPAGNFTYIVSYSNGACTVSDSTFICVYPTPSVTIISPDSICIGMTANFTSNVLGGSTPFVYTWSGLVGGSTSSVSLVPVVSGTETIHINDDNGCSTSASVPLVVLPVPDVMITSPGDTCICDGSSITIHATGTPSYSWNNGFTGPDITVSPNANFTYVVTYFNGGCADSDSAAICVNPSPVVIASADTVVQLESPAFPYVTGTGPFTWTPSNSLSCDSCTHPTATPTETTTYTISTTNAFGCTITDEVTVSILYVIIIPNVITPNGDGINDNFRIVSLPDGSAVSIFNRWGNLLYESKSYDNNWSIKSDGVYYYIIVTPEGKNFHGFFHVVHD